MKNIKQLTDKDLLDKVRKYCQKHKSILNKNDWENLDNCKTMREQFPPQHNDNEVKDASGRLLLKINPNGTMIVVRYEDMHPVIKIFMVLTYIECTTKTEEDILQFLNFEEKNEEDIFCS